jgi:signal transduction histidine kinase
VCETFGTAEGKRVAVLPDAQAIVFRTDPSLLGRVLINLIKNALEASMAGSVVTASCGRTAAGNILFSIHNDAVMPEKVRVHVFKRSFTTKGAGRGLGTYRVKLLTETYMGGHAWFESAAGHGTTFHVEFPG